MFSSQYWMSLARHVAQVQSCARAEGCDKIQASYCLCSHPGFASFALLSMQWSGSTISMHMDVA